MKAIKLAAIAAVFALAAPAAYADVVATCAATIKADSTSPTAANPAVVEEGCKCMDEKTKGNAAAHEKFVKAASQPTFAERMATIGPELEPAAKECFKF